MEVTVALAWLTLAVGVPVNVTAALLLRRQARAMPRLRVLRERFLVAVVTTCVVAFFGVIFVNNDQTVPPLDLETTKLITRSAMLGMAIIPATGWLLVYRALGRRTKNGNGK